MEDQFIFSNYDDIFSNYDDIFSNYDDIFANNDNLFNTSDNLFNISYNTSTIPNNTSNVLTKAQTNIPISNICFPAKTCIKTDQGLINIENICSETNTINNKKIVAITKTITLDKYLILLDKNALGINLPNKKTIISKNHKIYYKGKLIEAYKFLGHFKYVSKIDYNGEILYNILMENYDKILVNNLICETLHPNNIIAKLYKTKYSEDYKEKIIFIINSSIRRNDYKSYKKITSLL